MRYALLACRIIDTLNRWVGRLMGVVAVALVLIGVINVVGRYAGATLGMQLSSNALIEAQSVAFSMMFMLAAAHVLRQNGHVRVDILHGMLSERGKAWVDVFGILFLLLPFCILALYFSVDYVTRSWRILESSPNPGGLPRYPIKTLILIGFSLLLLQGVSDLVRRIAWLRGAPGVDGPHGGQRPAEGR